jgi:hypothetical protein
MRALEAGYGGLAVGELLGSGFLSADSIVQTWLDDWMHREVLLRAGLDEAGVDFFAQGDTSLWAMLVGVQDGGTISEPATLVLITIAMIAGVAGRRRRL